MNNQQLNEAFSELSASLIADACASKSRRGWRPQGFTPSP
jgi:hypothetical protein